MQQTQLQMKHQAGGTGSLFKTNQATFTVQVNAAQTKKKIIYCIWPWSSYYIAYQINMHLGWFFCANGLKRTQWHARWQVSVNSVSKIYDVLPILSTFNHFQWQHCGQSESFCPSRPHFCTPLWVSDPDSFKSGKLITRSTKYVPHGSSFGLNVTNVGLILSHKNTSLYSICVTCLKPMSGSVN